MLLFYSLICVNSEEYLEISNTDVVCNQERKNCSKGWYDYEKQCFKNYYIENKYFRKTWEDAKVECEKAKSKLVSFSNLLETLTITKCQLS